MLKNDSFAYLWRQFLIAIRDISAKDKDEFVGSQLVGFQARNVQISFLLICMLTDEIFNVITQATEQLQLLIQYIYNVC